MKNFEVGVGCSSNSKCSRSNCNNANVDFCIKRGDSKPSFKVSVEDCDGVLDLTDENLVLEANMWFDAKLKSDIDSSVSSIMFADNIGFDQIKLGDVILTNRNRDPEKMLVVGIDESSKVINVQRAYDSTISSSWPKGSSLKIFRFIERPAEIESVFEEITNVDGTTSEELSDTFMVFNWDSEHTSISGCYWLEFKLIMMQGSSILWTKKTPLSKEGFFIRIINSPLS